MPKRIAIIFHENEWKHTLLRFAIWHLAEIWKKQNISIHLLFGVRKYIPADIAVLHVDLSRVPDKYIDFAHRYPIVLNGCIRDIRKSQFSNIKIDPNDGYRGPAIVKSELNYAGQPERKLLGSFFSRLALRITSRMPSYEKRHKASRLHFKSPLDYKVYENCSSVPKSWFDREDILVERFVPEIQEGLYCLRNYHFLGSSGICMLRKSAHPIINMSNTISRDPVEVHPDIPALARSMGFDYGKFDFVLHEGKPVLLDANKTPGAALTPVFFDLSREWAKGIQTYL
jgi:hypothetical protein